MRKTVFANEEYYHIYNRGVDKRDVFLDDADYNRFLISLREFNCSDAIGSLYEKSLRDKKGSSAPTMGAELPKLVEIVAYCLNPNHFHLILRQNAEKGIERFMHKVSTGYTNYFNKKQKRSGSLFQGRFKAIHIDSNEYLLYLSAYVNRNNFIHGYNSSNGSSTPTDWKYCSSPDYTGKRSGTLCEKNVILDQFKDEEEYANFLNINSLHLKEKKEMQECLLEE